MSIRWWIGPEEKQWADHNLCNYVSIEAMVKETIWSGAPAKAYAANRDAMTQFLYHMEKMGFDRDRWSDLQIGDENNWRPYA